MRWNDHHTPTHPHTQKRTHTHTHTDRHRHRHRHTIRHQDIQMTDNHGIRIPQYLLGCQNKPTTVSKETYHTHGIRIRIPQCRQPIPADMRLRISILHSRSECRIEIPIWSGESKFGVSCLWESAVGIEVCVCVCHGCRGLLFVCLGGSECRIEIRSRMFVGIGCMTYDLSHMLGLFWH